MTIFVCAALVTLVAAGMIYRLGHNRPVEPSFPQSGSDAQAESVPNSELIQGIRSIRQNLVDQHDLVESHLRRLESVYGPETTEEARVCAQVVCTLRQTCDRLVDAYDIMRQVDDRLLQSELDHGVLGIESRSALDPWLSERFALQSRYGNQFSLALISLGAEKRTPGQVREIGKMLAQLVRETDRIFQYSDCEVLVALPETDLEGCRLFGRRLRQAAADELQFVLRMGLAVAELEDNARSLLNRADAALFQASCDEDHPAFLHDGEHIQSIGASQVCGGSVIVGL